MSKFRFVIMITTFNKQTKLTDGWEKCTTSPMTYDEFKIFLPKRLKKIKGGYCFSYSKRKAR